MSNGLFEEFFGITSDNELGVDQQLACDTMVNNYLNFFVTGAAGTGKSTLLRYMLARNNKNTVIVAPSGIAALNAGGSTIHSFFKLPLGFINKEDIKHHGNNEYNMVKTVERLFIDEISMVRADVLDGIDWSLRKNKGVDIPFGGAQVIMFGDLHQLPPVVTDNDARELRTRYKSPYFFDSRVMRESPAQIINLTQIFRQKDEIFIELLNRMKSGRITHDDLILLNERCHKPDYEHEHDIINLCTVNKVADTINDKMMSQLNTPEKIYVGALDGEFKETAIPVPMKIVLKEGCRVMFRNNDQEKRWFNGTLGVVKQIKPSGTLVVLLDNGMTMHVEKHTWEQKKYKLDRSTGLMMTMVVGTYTQIPVIPAWAITIHKCIEENQLIKVNGGWKPIKEVNIGDYVLTHKNAQKRITDKFESGIKKCYKITTKYGMQLTCADTHPIMIGDGTWKKLSDLNKNDIILIINEGDSSSVTEKCDFSYLMGYLCGDGNYSGSQKKDKYRIDIAFNKKDKDLICEIDAILKQLGGNPVNELMEKWKNGKMVSKCRTRIQNKEIRMKLYHAGLDFVKKIEKRVPHFILNGSRIEKASFISGFFDSDGGCSQNQIRANNVSHEMLKQIQLLLLDLNIGSTINPIKKGKLTKNIAYMLRISNNDILKFKNMIGFRSEYKSKYLDDLSSSCGIYNLSQYWVNKNENTRIEILNKTDSINSDIRRKIRKTLRIKAKNINSNLINDAVKCFDIANIPVDDMMRKFGEFKYNHDVIKSIEYVGESMTYDIEVEDDHSFISQGIVCHNSQGCTFDKAHINFGDGTFVTGQAYTAISRLSSLEGLTLAKPLVLSDIKFDKQILEYLNQ